MKISTIKYLLLSLLFMSCNTTEKKQVSVKATAQEESSNQKENNTMKLGAFSQSLSVKDLAKSKKFYENLDFKVIGGGEEMNYYIMKNENAVIGIFQGMFEGNIMTFNPGWDENGKNTDTYDDVRKIQKHLKSKGIELITQADESTTGPASLMVKDPDGNLIMIDQHR